MPSVHVCVTVICQKTKTALQYSTDRLLLSCTVNNTATTATITTTTVNLNATATFGATFTIDL